MYCTYIDIDARESEYGDCLVPVPRDVSEELVAVLVPLDRVQLFPFQIVEAFQDGALPHELVAGHTQPDQADALGAWGEKEKKKNMNKMVVQALYQTM